MRAQLILSSTAALLLAVQSGLAAPKLSNVPRQDFWVTDGTVSAIAVTNNRVFIGGDFTHVGEWTGGGVPVDLTTMKPVAKYPKVNGSVHAVVGDGQGGWFIGGDFATVGGRPRTNLAHITAEGDVDANWTAHATAGGDEPGLVTHLALDGSTLYAAGAFTNLGGLSRRFVGAVETASGAVRPWAPQLDGNVLALAVSPKEVYLGGTFRYVGESNRNYVAAIDKTSGHATSWDPNADVFPHGYVTNGFVYAITTHSNLVFVGGPFYTFFSINYLVAIDEESGLRTWGAGRSYFLNVLKVHDDQLFVGGFFGEIGGDGENGHVPRNSLAALVATTGEVLPWAPVVGSTGVNVKTMAFANGSVFVGGQFRSPNPPFDPVNQTNADHIATFSISTAEESGPRRPWNNGWVNALAVQGNQIYFGGNFDSLAGNKQRYLAELDLRDGTKTAWSPELNYGVSALALTDYQLLVGGSFSEIDSELRSHLAAIHLDDLSVSDWAPAVEGKQFVSVAISELLPAGDDVLVTGEFVKAGGQSRTNVAMVGLNTGEATGWTADTDAAVHTAAIANGRVYLGGQFSKVGGVDRPHLAAVDLVTGAVDPWNPQPDRWVTHLSANSTGLYASGYFRRISGLARTNFAAFAITDGSLLPWNLHGIVIASPTGRPLLATETNVFLTGIFFESQGRASSLINVATNTGIPFPWETRPYLFLRPERLLFDGSSLFVVGDHAAGRGPKRMGIAVYPPAGFSRFSRISTDGTAVQLRLLGDAGLSFQIDRSMDLDQWVPISTNTAWEGMIEFSDTVPNVDSKFFYRSKKTP